MKKNFDTSALRKTAADIQGAVVPKSITADMVGGLFSALVEAQGEVIEALGALEREVVTVKVNGYDGDGRVSAAGAKVYVDIFSIGSVPTVALPRQELTANEEGVVTFEVFKGYQYAVFSKIEGLGASFQFTYTAALDARTIELWNMPTGIYMLGYTAYCGENDEYRCLPFVSDEFVEDLFESSYAEWDIRDNESVEDCGYYGVLVSTADTSFVIPQNSRSEDYLMWADRSDYGNVVPAMPLYPIEPEKFDGNWEDAWMYAVEQVHGDFNGCLNTAKILASCNNPIAAKWAASIEEWNYGQCFLPSAGQLYLMYINKSSINALIEAANEQGFSFSPIDNEWYWSSTQEDEFCAWGVDMRDGYTLASNKYYGYYVRAVSAFHFIY